MEILTTILNIIGGAIAGGGSLWAVMALIKLGTAIHDQQGPGIQQAAFQLAGAVVVILAGALCVNIKFQ